MILNLNPFSILFKQAFGSGAHGNDPKLHLDARFSAAHFICNYLEFNQFSLIFYLFN